MLRDYQNKTISELFSKIREGYKSVLVVLSCGAGKSTIFSRFCEICVENDKKVLFIVHRDKLVEQFRDRLMSQFGIDSGIIKSGHKMDLSNHIQVASIQTLVRRDLGDWSPNVIIIDEAHRSKSNSYKKALEAIDHNALVGLTATPERLDGSGLDDLFSTYINPIKMNELISKGYLVGCKYYEHTKKINKGNIISKRGEYDDASSIQEFNRVYQGSDIADHWRQVAEGKKTIMFCTNIQHSKDVAQALNNNGVRSIHVDGTMRKEEIDEAISLLENGEVDLISNVNLFIEGVDIPTIECAILMRATKSKMYYVQMVGRAQRPSEGKKEAIIIDYGGNVMEHCPVEDYDLGDFDLKGRKGQKKKKQESLMKSCKKCGMLVRLGEKICECGYEFKGRQIESNVSGVKSKIVEISKEQTLVNSLSRMSISKIKTMDIGYFLLYERVKGYKKGWAVHAYREKLGLPLVSYSIAMRNLEAAERKLNLHLIKGIAPTVSKKKFFNPKWKYRNR